MEIGAGYKKTEVGIIPKDWEVKELDKEIDLLTGLPFPSNKYSTTGIRLLRGSNVKRGKTDWSPDITQYWENLTFDLKPYVLTEGDIVVAMDGSLVGKSFARLTKSDLPALLLQRVARIRSNKIDLGYLKEFICSDYFTKYCETVKTVSAIPHISPSDIRKFTIPLPPTKSEQTAIATALSDIDALLTSLEKLIAKKRNIKQGAMQELLKPKEGWKVKKLGEIVGKITTGKLDANAMNENGEYRFYTCAKDYYFIDNYAFDDEALLVSGNGANVGYIHYYKGKFNAYQRTYVLTGFAANVTYIKLFMDGYLKDRITTEVSAGNTPYIKMDTLTDMLIHIPKSKEEQTHIANILSDMDAEIVALETKLDKYKMIKQGMMQNLLTGKIRLI